MITILNKEPQHVKEKKEKEKEKEKGPVGQISTAKILWAYMIDIFFFGNQ